MPTLPPPAMPHVVVDTNILVRAIIKSVSSDGQVFRLFLDGKVTLYYSQMLFEELTRVLSYSHITRKYHLTVSMTETFLHSFTHFGKYIVPTEKIELCRDADDNELLSIAASLSDKNKVYIITADKDLLVLQGKVEGIEIVTPQKFLRVIRPRSGTYE